LVSSFGDANSASDTIEIAGSSTAMDIMMPSGSNRTCFGRMARMYAVIRLVFRTHPLLSAHPDGLASLTPKPSVGRPTRT
jgi:hypothetical protein